MTARDNLPVIGFMGSNPVMAIHLSESMRAYVAQRAEDGRYGSESEFVAGLCVRMSAPPYKPLIHPYRANQPQPTDSASRSP